MSWSSGWRNSISIGNNDKDTKNNKAKHLSIFGGNLKRSFLGRRDPQQKDILSNSPDNKTAWRWTPAANKNDLLNGSQTSSPANKSPNQIPSKNGKPFDQMSIASTKSANTKNIITKEGYLSKKTDVMSGTSLSSALGRGWNVYRVVLKGAKIFFYKPPPESALKTLFNHEIPEKSSEADESARTGMPLTPMEIDSGSRAIFFDPVVSEGIIQKPLSERYVFGECFTEVEVRSLKFKRYVCVLIFEDKIAILKRRWVKEGRASSFFVAVSNKIRFTKKNPPSIRDNSSLVSAEFGIKGKGHFTKWKNHAIYLIKNVEVVGSTGSHSQNQLGTINSSKNSMYSVGNQSVSSVMTQTSTMSKDYSGMISAGVATGFQMYVSGNQTTTRVFVATSMDAKNNWMARFSVAKVSYSRRLREKVREKTQSSAQWNSGPTPHTNEVRARTASRNIDQTTESSTINANQDTNILTPSNISSSPKPQSNQNSTNPNQDDTAAQPKEKEHLSHKSSENGSVPQNLNLLSSNYEGINKHPDLVVRNGVVIGGTPESLVHEAVFTTTAESTRSSSFIKPFIATYDNFMKTEKLLHLLEKFTKVIDPTDQKSCLFVENVGLIVSLIVEYHFKKLKKSDISILENIVNNTFQSLQGLKYDSSHLINSLNTMDTSDLQSFSEIYQFKFENKDLKYPNSQRQLLKSEKLTKSNLKKSADLESIDLPTAKHLTETKDNSDLSKLMVTGLSTTVLLRISPEDLAKQIYLFHASIFINLDTNHIKYYLSQAVASSNERPRLQSLLTIEQNSANNFSTNDPSNIKTFNSKKTQQNLGPNSKLNSPKNKDSQESANQSPSKSFISNAAIKNTFFFTPDDPHFFTRLIHHHLLVELPQNKPQPRKAVLLHWIKVGEASRAIGDTIMWAAIAIAVTSSPIARLRETWSLVPLEYKTIITTQWIPILIKYGFYTIYHQDSTNSSFKPDTLLVNNKGSSYPSIPFYGTIRNIIERSGREASIKISTEDSKKISSIDGVLFEKYNQMFNTSETIIKKIEGCKDKHQQSIDSIRKLLSSSDLIGTENLGLRIRSRSTNSAFEIIDLFEFSELSITSKSENPISSEDNFFKVIPEAQIYLRSISELPQLFINDFPDENDGKYDIKYLVTLSLQCEPSISDLYQEMVQLDLNNEDAIKNDLPGQIASVRTDEELKLSSSAILPLVSPEIVTSTNVLQWISPLKRDDNSIWRTNSTSGRKSQAEQRSTTEQSRESENMSKAYKSPKVLPVFPSLNPSIEPNTEFKVTMPKLNSDDKVTTKKSESSKMENFASTISSLTRSDPGDFKNVDSPITRHSNEVLISPHLTNIERDAVNTTPLNTNAKQESQEGRGKSLSVSKKPNIELSLPDFSKLSIRDNDSKIHNHLTSPSDSIKGLSHYVGSIIYNETFDISMKVIRIQYITVDSKVRKTESIDSRRSSISSKRNSTGLLSGENWGFSPDTQGRPVGFFVQVNSASLEQIMRISLEGLGFVENVYDNMNSSEPITLSNDISPKLFIDNASFLHSFLATYRQFTVEVYIMNYLIGACFGNPDLNDDTDSITNIKLLPNILNFVNEWVLQYAEDFMENSTLLRNISHMLSRIYLCLSKKKAEVTKSNSNLTEITELNENKLFRADSLNSVQEAHKLPRMAMNSSFGSVDNSYNVEDSKKHLYNFSKGGNSNETENSLAILDELLNRVKDIQRSIVYHILMPAGFSHLEKKLDEGIKLGVINDKQLNNKKAQQKSLVLNSNMNYHETSDFKDNPNYNFKKFEERTNYMDQTSNKYTREDGKTDDESKAFYIGNYTPIEVLSSLNRLVQLYFAKCTPRDWQTTFCILEVQTRIPLSWFSVKKTNTHSDDETIISDIFKVLNQAVRPSAAASTLESREAPVSGKYLSSIGISLMSSLGGGRTSSSNDTQGDISLVSTLPSNIRTLLEIHGLIRTWVIQQITDPFISSTERYQRLCFFLYIIHLFRSTKNQSASKVFEEALSLQPHSSHSLHQQGLGDQSHSSANNRRSMRGASVSSTIPTTSNDSPKSMMNRNAQIKIDRRLSSRKVSVSRVNHYVPSFVERAIASALVSPESRLFTRAWNQIAVVHHVTLSTLELMLKGVRDWSFDRWFHSASALVPGESMNTRVDNNNSPSKDHPHTEEFFVPCVGWLLENLISLCYDSPDLIGKDKQINFTKRQNVNMMMSVCSYFSERSAGVIFLPVVQRLSLEQLSTQLSNNPGRHKKLKFVANEENNIPLYAKPQRTEFLNFSSEISQGNNQLFGSGVNSLGNQKSRTLGQRASKTRSNLPQSAYGQNATSTSFVSSQKNSRSVLSQQSQLTPGSQTVRSLGGASSLESTQNNFVGILPFTFHNSGTSTNGTSRVQSLGLNGGLTNSNHNSFQVQSPNLSFHNSGNHLSSMEKVVGNFEPNNRSSSIGHSGSGISSSNQQLSGNRFLSFYSQGQMSPNSAVIALIYPFSRLVQDEQEKQKHEVLERQKLEREFRERRQALEKFRNDRTKVLKKQLKEQQQRTAKSQQLIKMSNLMSKVDFSSSGDGVYGNKNSETGSDSVKGNPRSSSLSSFSFNVNFGQTKDSHSGSNGQINMSGNSSISKSEKPSVDSGYRMSIDSLKQGMLPRGPSLPSTLPANVINLINSVISVEQGYTKRDFVFRIVTEEGGQHLLQAPSEAEMNEWISAMSDAAVEAATRRMTVYVQDAKKKNALSSLSSSESSMIQEARNMTPTSSLGFEPLPSPNTPGNNQYLNNDPKRSYSNSISSNAESTFSSSLPNSVLSSGVSPLLGVPKIDKQIRKPKNKSFGVLLKTLMPDEKIPPFVMVRCIAEIERRGLAEIGIYRISGSTIEVSRIKSLLNANPETADLGPDAFPDINAIASVLKQFLREIPEPLIPANLQSGFINAAEINDYDERLWAIKDLISALPPRNFTVIKCIIEHLERVTDYEEINHMYASNLAVVFGPNMIHPSSNDSTYFSAMSSLGQIVTIVKNMILQYHWLFDVEEEAGIVSDAPITQNSEAEANVVDLSTTENRNPES
ncbi:hypothetical protein BB558_000141 [Smittium angustum]|uniref:Ras-GEF domain-containing protein n=1 Tax=Smittium angustum TaxID=133377 RepID=A0A2U1JFB3_SMIAN|nr:hypothetical protein BB558_000141 [Smittium angustum]